MSAGLPARVRYRERQVLAAADLAAEQGYRIAQERRHLAGHHRWGIAAGLSLSGDAEGLLVQPGVGIDGFGREVVLTEPWRVPLGTLRELARELGSQELAVWLLYGREPANPPQRGRRACGAGRHGRWLETPRLRFTGPGPAADPRRPPGVSAPDLGSPAHRIPPDDPAVAWPLFLGTLELSPGSEPPVRVDPSGRPYAGLAGALLRDPLGRVRLELSPGAGGGAWCSLCLRDAEDNEVERLRLGRPAAPVPPRGRRRAEPCPRSLDAGSTPPRWEARIRARTRSGRDDRGRAAGVVDGVTFHRAAPPPEEPAPWRIYRTAVGDDPAVPAALRIELGPAPEELQAVHRLAVGADGATAFLTVGADGTTRIPGGLRVEGRLVHAPVPADPEDPDFGKAIAKQWLSGVGKALGIPEEPPSSEYPLQVTVEGIPQLLTAGVPFEFDISVTNGGASTLRAVNVVEATVLEQASAEVTFNQLVPNLPPGQSLQFKRELTAAAAGQLFLSVLVVAVDPGRELVTRIVLVGRTVISAASEENSDA